jgi:hypothetical protein
VLSSGLGGVYPKGIPVGTVTSVVREQAGWERVYRLLPAASPGAVAHVLVLISPPGTSLARAFPSDSALLAMRLDSIAEVGRADSLEAAKARRADSLATVKAQATAAAKAQAAAKARAAAAAKVQAAAAARQADSLAGAPKDSAR